jgi:small-conductance mechanosensitive channel
VEQGGAIVGKAGKPKVTTTFAGKLWPVLAKFHIGPMKAKEIAQNVLFHTEWQDMVFLLFIAYGIQPLAKFSYNHMPVQRKENQPPEEEPLSYEQGKRFGAATLASQLGKVGLGVYAVDVVCVILTTLGFHFPGDWQLHQVYAKVAYSRWALVQFLTFKKLVLCRIYKVPQDDMGRVDILNRFLNGLSIGVVSLLVFDWLSLQMGIALKGIFAFGSVGTLAFTLASQGLVSQLISGFFLSASDKAYAGDEVKFGDGTSGRIIKMGWMETVLRGGDNIITSIPNSQLASQKISNLSRVRLAQVKQTLRFHYNDADEIPGLLQTIRREVQASCPQLITNGSRPFRVYFTNFNEDHLEVMVDTHHSVKPIGDEYWNARQLVLLAIARAVKLHGVQFAQLVRYEAPRQTPQWRILPEELQQDEVVVVDNDRPLTRERGSIATEEAEELLGTDKSTKNMKKQQEQEQDEPGSTNGSNVAKKNMM